MYNARNPHESWIFGKPSNGENLSKSSWIFLLPAPFSPEWLQTESGL